MITIKPCCDKIHDPSMTDEELEKKMASLRSNLSEESLASVDAHEAGLRAIHSFLNKLARAVLKETPKCWLKAEDVAEACATYNIVLEHPAGTVSPEYIAPVLYEYFNCLPRARGDGVAVRGYIVEQDGHGSLMLGFYKATCEAQCGSDHKPT